MRDSWKLWPEGYWYDKIKIGAGILCIYFAGVFMPEKFIRLQTDEGKLMLPEVFFYGLIFFVGICLILRGVAKNIKVGRLRRNREKFMTESSCYLGKIVRIEHETGGDTKEGEGYLQSYAIVEYTDEAGNSQKIMTGTYLGALESCLVDSQVHVYVGKGRQDIWFDNFSWRQSKQDSFIQTEGNALTESQKGIMYFLVRNETKILYGLLLFVMVLASPFWGHLK